LMLATFAGRAFFCLTTRAFCWVRGGGFRCPIIAFFAPPPPLRPHREFTAEAPGQPSSTTAESGLLFDFTASRSRLAKLLKPACPFGSNSVADGGKAFLPLADKRLRPPAAGLTLPAHLSRAAGVTQRPSDIRAVCNIPRAQPAIQGRCWRRHANLLRYFRAIGKRCSCLRTTSGVSWLPLYHDHGLDRLWLTLLQYGHATMRHVAALVSNKARNGWLHAFSQAFGRKPSPLLQFSSEMCVRKIGRQRDIGGPWT